MGDFCLLKKCGKKKEAAKPAAPPAPPAAPPVAAPPPPPCHSCSHGRNADPLSRVRSMEYVKLYRVNYWDDDDHGYYPPPPLSRSMSARSLPPPLYSHYDVLPAPHSHYQLPPPPPPPRRYGPSPQLAYGPSPSRHHYVPPMPQYDYCGHGAAAHDYIGYGYGYGGY